ncbi:MAG: transglutaminase domain-containing protein [Actinomycetota bacterium]
MASSGTDERTLAATRILDHEHPEIRRFVASLPSASTQADLLREAHGTIAGVIRPVYSVDERRPASQTLARRAGSCSQRFAVLEAVARASGIPTRVRAMRVRGSFWYPRFRLLRPLIPRTVVLVWPAFFVDDDWVDISDLFPTAATDIGFTNDGETLFDAVRSVPIDWDGTRGVPACDLSGAVGEDLGVFACRDDVFAVHMTSPAWLLALADPILRHRTPRSSRSDRRLSWGA